MKTKNFENLAKELLTQEQMNAAKERARLRCQMMEEISNKVIKQMSVKKIGFNELVKKMHTSPTHLNKILHGSGNITLDSLIRVCTALEIEPHLIFKSHQ